MGNKGERGWWPGQLQLGGRQCNRCRNTQERLQDPAGVSAALVNSCRRGWRNRPAPALMDGGRVSLANKIIFLIDHPPGSAFSPLQPRLHRLSFVSSLLCDENCTIYSVLYRLATPAPRWPLWRPPWPTSCGSGSGRCSTSWRTCGWLSGLTRPLHPLPTPASPARGSPTPTPTTRPPPATATATQNPSTSPGSTR